jgi:CheY-like chemotaxis protein
MTTPARILVVDDEPDVEALVTQKFRRQMRKGEMDFVFAHDGQHALELLDGENGIDMVLSDINMPRMDGLTLLDKLGEQHANLKTVIVSAYGDMGNIRTAMNRGAFDFVTKPIEFEDLETGQGPGRTGPCHPVALFLAQCGRDPVAEPGLPDSRWRAPSGELPVHRSGGFHAPGRELGFGADRRAAERLSGRHDRGDLRPWRHGDEDRRRRGACDLRRAGR